MEDSTESFHAVRTTTDLQNYQVIVLSHFRASFRLIPGRWWISNCHRMWSAAQKAKSLISQQCLQNLDLSAELYLFPWLYAFTLFTQFLQFHALACLSTSVFNLFSNTAEEEAWEVPVASWAPIRWTPSRCFTRAYEHLAATGKIIQSLPIWSRSWIIISILFAPVRPQGWIPKDFPEHYMGM